MNITVNDSRTLSIDVGIVATDPYISAASVDLLLQTWCDRPTRSWLRVCDDFVIISSDEGRIEATTFEPSPGAIYSLNALSRALSPALTWGEGIGEPTPEQQEIIARSLSERVHDDGFPADYATLLTLVMRVAADVL